MQQVVKEQRIQQWRKLNIVFKRIRLKMDDVCLRRRQRDFTFLWPNRTEIIFFQKIISHQVYKDFQDFYLEISVEFQKDSIVGGKGNKGCYTQLYRLCTAQG